MKNVNEEIVLYSPPKSTGFGHAARRRDKYEAWQEVQNFLKYFDFVIERNAQLTVYGKNNDSFNKVHSILNTPTYASDNSSRWDVPPNFLAEIIELSLQEFPKDYEETLSLNFFYSLKWKNIKKSEELITSFLYEPHHKHSDLGISIKHNIFLQPKIMFPFSYQDKRLYQLITKLKKDSPFKFRDGYFKRVSRLKTKTGYRTKKLEKEWLNNIIT